MSLSMHEENAAVARHGWAALLKLLVAKGLITQDESMGVTRAAHEGANNFERFGIANTATRCQQFGVPAIAPIPAPAQSSRG